MYSSFYVCVFCMCESLSLCKMYYVYVCVHHVHAWYPQRLEEGIGFCGTGIIVVNCCMGSRNWIWTFWKGYMQMLFTAELSSLYLKIILYKTFNVFVRESLMVGNFDIITSLPQKFIILDLKIVNQHTFYMILWVKSWEREFNMLSSIHYHVFQNLLS